MPKYYIHWGGNCPAIVDAPDRLAILRRFYKAHRDKPPCMCEGLNVFGRPWSYHGLTKLKTLRVIEKDDITVCLNPQDKGKRILDFSHFIILPAEQYILSITVNWNGVDSHKH